MLLAPFALTEPTAASSRKPTRRSLQEQAQITPRWLVAWAVLGCIGVILFPALRGGDFGGLTLPFWLAAAPCISIVGLTRERWLPRLQRIVVRDDAKTHLSTGRRRR